MRRLPPAALLLLLAGALGASCSSVTEEHANDVLQDIMEFIGGTKPARHVERLALLHDPSSFRHVPDLPPTTASCLDEARALAEADYESWREVAVSTFYVTRVVCEDSSAFNRGEAVRALVRLGGMVLEHEEPPATPATGDRAAKSLQRLREIHEKGTNLHASPAAVGECAEQVGVLGSFRTAAAPDALRAEMQYELRLLRGTLMGLMVETSSPESHGTGEAAAAIDRAVLNLSAQAVRLSLAFALRFDGQPTVRAAAAESIERLGVPGMAGVLRAALGREESGAVRHRIVAAAAAAARPGGSERETGVILLVAALSDDDESVRFVARDALRGIAGADLGPRPEPWVHWWNTAGRGAGK
jgi:hypothetical protein